MRPVPVSAIALRTLAVPSILMWSFRPRTHAQCATTSAPVIALSTAVASRISAAMKSAELGQLSGR